MKSAEELMIEALKKGDRAAQGELYQRYSALLLAIAVRYLGNLSEAEDLLHDSFIKIFSSIGGFKYRGAGSLKAWLSRIVVNDSLGRLRSRAHAIALEHDSLERVAASVENEDDPHFELVPQQRLLEFIAELPDGYRAVFNLFCIEGYSHREIAQSLGINEKSSSSQLLRAKRLLATKVKSYIDSNE